MLEVIMNKEVPLSMLFLTDDTLTTEHIISEIDPIEFIKVPTVTFLQVENLLKQLNVNTNMKGRTSKLELGLLTCGLFIINMDTTFYIAKINVQGKTPKDSRLQYIHTSQLIYKSLCRNKFEKFDMDILMQDIYPYPIYLTQAYIIDITEEPYNDAQNLTSFLHSLLIDEMR